MFMILVTCMGSVGDAAKDLDVVDEKDSPSQKSLSPGIMVCHTPI